MRSVPRASAWVRRLVAAVGCCALLAACHGGAPDNASKAAIVTPPPSAPPPAPNPAIARAQAAELGRAIFFDASLSASGKMSCASCHSPAHAYGPPNDLAVQLGGPGLDMPGLRSVPSLRYVLNRTPHWFKQYQANPIERITETDSVPTGGFARDGRFDSLHEQARAPLLSANEMANASPAAVVAKLRAAPYADQFRRLFGSAVFDNDDLAFGKALEALERFELDDPSLRPYTSKFDRHLKGETPLSVQEARGLALFDDPKKGNCASCHTSAAGADGSPPLFTDFSFSTLGAPRNRRLAANADPSFHDLGLCGPVRGDQAGQTTYCGMFKTPSLRNVAARGVFLHNGVFTNLADVVRFYAERDVHPGKWYPARHGVVERYDDLPPAYRENIDTIDAPLDRKPGQAPALNESEVQDIVAFLCTLTDADAAAEKKNCGGAR
jgi:cytochrome c peroxidase